MKVTVEQVSAVQKRILVEMPSDKVVSKLDGVYNKLKKTAQIKGFRSGKIPRSILERYYRPQAEQEAMSALIGEAYPEILKEHDIDAVAEPDIEKVEINEDKSLVFKALVPVRPSFEPEGYKGIEVERLIAKVTQEQIDQEIERIRENQAQMAPVEEDRPLKNGDFADIDFEGFLKGEAFAGGKADGHQLELGSGMFIPGFEDQLIDAKVGENKEVKVTFPENYGNKVLAGQEVIFKVKINGIKKKEIPELDDNLAKGLDGANLSTVEELKEYVEKGLLENQEQQTGRQMRQALAEKLVETIEFEVPAVMIEKQLAHILESAKQQLAYGGIPAEQAAALVENRRAEYRGEAERQVRFSLILDRIGQKEGLSVEDQELQDKFQEISEITKKPIEAIRAEYQKENRLEELRDRLRDEKVVNLIVDNAKVKMVDELTVEKTDNDDKDEAKDKPENEPEAEDDK